MFRPEVVAFTPLLDSLMMASTWQPSRMPLLFFMQPLPMALTPAGPSTSGPPWALSYTESNGVDQAKLGPPAESANFETLPVCETPNGPGAILKYLPASATYMLPWPSKATPRGPFSPPTTGVIVQLAADATPPVAKNIAAPRSAAATPPTDLDLRITNPAPT